MPDPQHNWLDRLLGRHQWVETSRYYRLWWTVNYRCLICGVFREGGDEARYSLDPKVRAEAIAGDRERARELRARGENPDAK